MSPCGNSPYSVNQSNDMISFIVPAHNEQAHLSRTLQAIHESARVVGQPYEIIVVDDSSTDASAGIARQTGARVVSVNHRQIAATRNSGARAAHGERLFFVDADTTVNPHAVASALRAMDEGAAGGGAWTRLEGDVPLYGLLLFWVVLISGRIAGFTGGAFMFCTSAAFRAAGGFNERLFCAEEVAFAFALKREGPFAVLWERVLTSGRRFRTTAGLQVLATFASMAFLPSKTVTRRASVENIWYESNRDGDENGSGSLAVKASNFIALLIMLFLLLQPVWHAVTLIWPQTLDGLFGALDRKGGIITCHVGLVAWPCAWFLFRALLVQKRWWERIKLAALIAICLWLAWTNTRTVIAIWMMSYQWLAQ